ncbi:hypothetical protein N9L68_00065 [bacterium]|nr:hypothetical protein [bacterium]
MSRRSFFGSPSTPLGEGGGRRRRGIRSRIIIQGKKKKNHQTNMTK